MAKKGGGQQVVTTAPDPQTQKRINEMMGAARAAGNTPGQAVNPLTQKAADLYGQYAGFGSLGLGALGGDQGAVNALMNPYQSSVMGRMDAATGLAQQQALKAVGDQATAQGAFGNSRQGLAEGQALGDIQRGALDQKANLLYSGFNDAMGRAGTLANLGFGATGAMDQTGRYMRDVAEANNPAVRQYQFLRDAMSAAPGGTQTTQPTQGSRAGGFLGGAATGAGIAGALGATGPWGWGLAGLGGLMGLF